MCWVELIWFDELSGSAKSWASNTESKPIALQHYTHIYLCHLYNFICIAMVTNMNKKNSNNISSRNLRKYVISNGGFKWHENFAIIQMLQFENNRIVYVCFLYFFFFVWFFSVFVVALLVFFLGQPLNSIEMLSACATRYTVLLMCQMSFYLSLFLTTTMIPVDCFGCTVSAITAM